MGDRLLSRADTVSQAKWKTLNDNEMVWDRPLGGLRWYLNKETKQMSFDVHSMPDDDALVEQLGKLGKEEHGYHDWLAIWKDQGWIKPGGENDLSFFNKETGKVEQWEEPAFPHDWTWWEDKALYRQGLEPRPLPEYRQLGAQSCAIDGMRMAVEGLTGIPVDRNDLLDYLDEQVMVMSEIKRGGIPFHTLPKIFDEYFQMRATAETARDATTLAGFLKPGQTVMLEHGSHVIVVDSVSGPPGTRMFAIRDPAQGVIETVPESDKRLKGTGRIVVVQG